MITRLIRQGLRSTVLTIVTIFPFPANTAEKPRQHLELSQIWARTELYFGTARQEGEVTDTEFSEFVDRCIAPRFPYGLTVISGYGQFAGSNGMVVRERSKVVILLYPVQAKTNDRLIEEIRTKYKKMFGQVSVLRVDSLSAVSF